MLYATIIAVAMIGLSTAAANPPAVKLEFYSPSATCDSSSVSPTTTNTYSGLCNMVPGGDPGTTTGNRSSSFKVQCSNDGNGQLYYCASSGSNACAPSTCNQQAFVSGVCMAADPTFGVQSMKVTCSGGESSGASCSTVLSLASGAVVALAIAAAL